MSIESAAILLGVVVIVMSVVLYLRSERGGEGPAVGHVPRPFRGIVNAWFGIMDWPIPFDRSGELIAVELRRRARDR